MPKVTYPGDIEADACGHGFGGFFTIGTTMYFFAGVWSEAERASFDSSAPLTLDINTLELATQFFLLYLGIDAFRSHTIMPKCDNDTSVVLKNSYKARSTHLAQLLEDYDHLSALNNVNVQMVHIPGVINRVSDILSRDGVCKDFYNAVRTDFPPHHLCAERVAQHPPLRPLPGPHHGLPVSAPALPRDPMVVQHRTAPLLFQPSRVQLNPSVRFGLQLGRLAIRSNTDSNYEGQFCTFAAYCASVHTPLTHPVLLHPSVVQSLGNICSVHNAEDVLIGFLGWAAALAGKPPKKYHYKKPPRSASTFRTSSV